MHIMPKPNVKQNILCNPDNNAIPVQTIQGRTTEFRCGPHTGGRTVSALVGTASPGIRL